MDCFVALLLAMTGERTVQGGQSDSVPTIHQGIAAQMVGTAQMRLCPPRERRLGCPHLDEEFVDGAA
jgi:hypothetical protein